MWFRFEFGFSLIGLIFLLCLMIPNLWFGLHAPAWQAESAASEPPALLIPERIGQALVSTLVLFSGNLRFTRWQPWSWWLVGAAALMALYLIAWIRYFRSAGLPADFYGPLLGIPLPLAVLPVAAAVLLGIYARSFWLIAAAALLGFGHIGIHLQHWLAFRQSGAG